MTTRSSLTRRQLLSWAGCGSLASLAGCAGVLSSDPVSITWEESIDDSRYALTVADGTAYVGTVWGLTTIDTESGETTGRNPAQAEVYGRPVVNDGIAYYGTLDGTIYAADETADERWRTEVPGSVVSCAVGDGRVYAATGIDGTHRLYALAVDSGDVIWENGLDAFPITSAPVFHDGHLLIQSGGVASFEPADGALRWRYEVDTDGSPVHAPTTIPATGGRFIYASFEENPGLLAVDIETGDRVWDVSSIAFASPVAHDGVVYVGAVSPESITGSRDEKFYAYDGSDGTQLWSNAIGQAASFGPVLQDDVVYATAGRSHDTLYALETTSGETMWEYEFETQSISQPIAADGSLYVVANDHETESLLKLAVSGS